MSNTMLENLKKLFDDPKFIEESKNYFKDRFEKREKNKKRMKRFYNDEPSFEKLILGIIEKHDDRWVDLCYSKGVMPYPWNVLYSICDIVEDEGREVEPFDSLTENFPSSLIEYHGWTFAWTHGQGTCLSIYDRNKELIYRE